MTNGQFYIIEILMRLHKLQAEWQGSDKNLFDFFHIEVESDFEGELEDALVDVDFYNKIKPYCNENLLSWLKQVKVDIDAIIVEYMEDNRGCCYPSVELSFYQDEGLRTKRKIRLVESIREHIERYELVHGKPQPEQAAPEPQREKPKSTRGKGRPKGSFKDRLVDDADGKKLERLHQVMKGKMGKDAALIMMAAMGRGWINKPTYQEVKDEFGDIGSRQGFSNYFEKMEKYTKEEFEGAKNSL